MWSGEGVAELEDGQVAGGGETEACEFCFGESASLAVPLSLEAVGLVQKFLLLPPKGEEEEEEGSGAAPWLCEDCASSLTSLADLHFHLEDIRREFNGIRRQLGRRLILGKLGQSQEVVEQWEERLKGVEHLFPSFLTNQPIGGEENKPDLMKMPVLTRMEPPPETEVMRNAGEKNQNDLIDRRTSTSTKKSSFGIIDVLENQTDGVEEDAATSLVDPETGVTSMNVDEDAVSVIDLTEEDSTSCIDLTMLTDTEEDETEDHHDFSSAATTSTSSILEFECSVCSEKFSNPSDLSRHICDTLHANVPQKFPCPHRHCSLTFARKTSTLRHIREVHDKGSYQCPSCPRRYAKAGNLRRHVERKHAILSSQPSTPPPPPSDLLCYEEMPTLNLHNVVFLQNWGSNSTQM